MFSIVVFMDQTRKEKVAKTTQALLDAVREFQRLRRRQQAASPSVEAARDRFRRAIGEFAEAIGE